MSSSLINEGVFEALFRQAVIDNFNEELDSLPTGEALAKLFTFSPAHELRMKKLFERDERREKIRAVVMWSRRVAVVIIAAATILLGAMMLSPQVRAAVAQTLTEWYENFARFTSNAPEAEKTSLEPVYIPEGFIVAARDDIPMITTIVYLNEDDGAVVTFQSFRAQGAVAVDNEDIDYRVAQIDGVEYHIFVSTDGINENAVVWDVGGQRYRISSTIAVDELIIMAISTA